MLLSMGSQRIRHDLATEQRQSPNSIEEEHFSVPPNPRLVWNFNLVAPVQPIIYG